MDVPEPEPVDDECLRCGRPARMRVPGLCDPCRAELVARYEPREHVVTGTEYVPKANVTANAVALRDD